MRHEGQFETAGGVWRRRRRAGLKLGRLSLLALVSAYAGWSFMYRAPVNEPVQLVTAQRRDVPVWVQAVGQVQPGNAVVVRPQVTGQLTQVLFTEGQQVNKGDLLAIIEPGDYQAQLEQARANKVQDEAQLAAAQQELKRLARTSKKPDVTRQTALRQTIRQFEAAIKSDQAAIFAATRQLEMTRIIAPISGRVGLRRVDEGNFVNPEDPQGLVEITQMKPVNVVFSLGEQYVPRAHGQPTAVEVTEGPGGNVLATGELNLADSQVEKESGAVKLKASFANADLGLWPGATVNVRMLTLNLPQALVVPAAAVLNNGQQQFVYVTDKDAKKVNLREVQVKLTTNDTAVIEKGLEPGERVVVQLASQTTQHAAAEAAALKPAR